MFPVSPRSFDLDMTPPNEQCVVTDCAEGPLTLAQSTDSRLLRPYSKPLYHLPANRHAKRDYQSESICIARATARAMFT